MSWEDYACPAADEDVGGGVQLRRGEYGEAIHGLLGPVDELLADLVRRGQNSDVFARPLPAAF